LNEDGELVEDIAGAEGYGDEEDEERDE